MYYIIQGNIDFPTYQKKKKKNLNIYERSIYLARFILLK